MTYGPKLIGTILVLFIGLWIIKLFIKSLRKGMVKANVDESLRNFLISFLNTTLKVILVIIIVSMLGVAMTSVVAILGAAGLAVGLALQGSLANLAGGVLILFFKPFRIGDVIEAQGFIGTVSEIQVFNTIVKTFDNKTIYVPNGSLSNDSIINYSTEPTRRVDMTFGIGYNDDIQKAKSIIKKLIDANSAINQQPEPFIVVSELGNSSVNITVRVWVNSENYWNVFFDMQEKVKIEFDKNGISIPFPQSDVHLYQEK
ncbi:MAG: mechanosensitive ion channel [Calditrichaceae bacterium]|nr:mechanosensitive ion channel [Calditrichaceae bacterium]MBN2709371.1 mechanosensitive ion channel [Calditrichaceae bacterium]